MNEKLSRKCSRDQERARHDADPAIMKLRQKLQKRQVVLRQPEVSTLQIHGLKDNGYMKKPRSFLLPNPKKEQANYKGI